MGSLKIRGKAPPVLTGSNRQYVPTTKVTNRICMEIKTNTVYSLETPVQEVQEGGVVSAHSGGDGAGAGPALAALGVGHAAGRAFRVC